MTRNIRSWSLAAIVILLFLLPAFVSSPYYLHIVIAAAVNIILAASLRLILTTGQVSFAHASFMAIGGYASALLTMRLGISSWLSLLLSALLVVIIAVLIGYPTLRIKGVYFFLASFAFGQVVLLVAVYWKDLTGGTFGLARIPAPGGISVPGLPTVEFVSKVPFYYYVLVLMLAILLVLYWIERSRIGLILKAISENDVLAECAGIDIMRYKVFAFALGSGLAAVAGAFWAHYFTSLSPDTFGFNMAIFIVIYAAVGGIASFSGPIVGALLLSLLGDFLSGIKGIEGFAVIIYGVALILVMIFVPEGVVGLVKKVWASARKTGPKDAARSGEARP